MILKSPAIVLRFNPFANTSRVVVWLTRDHGKLATLVKGAQRPKSPFLGQFDLFYTCELLFYARADRQRAHIARECTPLNLRPELRRDWRAAAAASYCCDAVARLMPFDTPQPACFDLLEQTLDLLCAHGASENLLFWYELKLLEDAGMTPSLAACTTCHQGIVPGAGAVFSATHGGVLCAACARTATAATAPARPDVLAMLTAWQQAPTPQAALNTRATPAQLRGLEALLGAFLEYHLAAPSPARAIALAACRT